MTELAQSTPETKGRGIRLKLGRLLVGGLAIGGALFTAGAFVNDAARQSNDKALKLRSAAMEVTDSQSDQYTARWTRFTDQNQHTKALDRDVHILRLLAGAEEGGLMLFELGLVVGRDYIQKEQQGDARSLAPQLSAQ